MRYYFFIREWNITFFLELIEKIKRKEPTAEVIGLTMHISVSEYFHQHQQFKIDCLYLPELLERAEADMELTKKVDGQLLENYGVGISALFSLERFKPKGNSDEFIAKHVNVFSNYLSTPGKFISLTMDHFVMILGAYMNRLQGGTSYFIQPVGFPRGVSIIMKSPYELHSFREPDNNFEKLEKFKASLASRPSDTIHYMMERSTVKKSLLDRVKIRLGLAVELLEKQKLIKKTNRYSYLDNITWSKNNSKKDSVVIVSNAKKNAVVSSIQEIQEMEGNVFFFPLHLEPEMTVLAYSPYFTNQLELIRLISSYMEFGDVLLIKENPKQYSRPVDFYEAINGFHNVKWLSQELNSRDVIRASRKVITLSGTSLIEAVLLGKEVLFTGQPPFHKLLGNNSITKSALTDFRSLLYTNSAVDLDHDWQRAYLEYSKSVFDGYFKFEVTNLEIISQRLSNPDYLADEFFKSVLCAE